MLWNGMGAHSICTVAGTVLHSCQVGLAQALSILWTMTQAHGCSHPVDVCTSVPCVLRRGIGGLLASWGKEDDEGLSLL
jgi:hypothetical protein